MINFYKDQVKKLKLKRDNETSKLEAKRLNQEIENYERAIRQSEPAKPTGVDAYLS